MTPEYGFTICSLQGAIIAGFGGVLVAIDFNQKERVAVAKKRELPSIAADAATRNWRDDWWLRYMFADGSMPRLARIGLGCWRLP